MNYHLQVCNSSGLCQDCLLSLQVFPFKTYIKSLFFRFYHENLLPLFFFFLLFSFQNDFAYMSTVDAENNWNEVLWVLILDVLGEYASGFYIFAKELIFPSLHMYDDFSIAEVLSQVYQQVSRSKKFLVFICYESI